jgi:uncharacterized membrane protein YphA (DoxX/SURF4 family)
MYILTTLVHKKFWTTHALVIARILMGGLFLFAAFNKFHGMDMTAGYIASVGFPIPLALAWTAAIFETLLGISIILGVCFREASLLACVYILFLGFTFHGPSHWASNPNDFGFFIDHFTMAAGLLFMIGHGVGISWSLKK